MKKFGLMLAVLMILSLVLAACVVATPAPAPAQEEATAAEEPAAEEAAAEEAAVEEPAEAVMLELFHDKPTWADNSDVMGQAAAESIRRRRSSGTLAQALKRSAKFFEARSIGSQTR